MARPLHWLSISLALFIGTVGTVSVYKAVYIDGRELKCACFGGASNVPLGFVSLTETVMMVAMTLWMLAAAFGLSVDLEMPRQPRRPRQAGRLQANDRFGADRIDRLRS